MVDFRKKLAGKKIAAPTNPVLLYDTLDRAHDKGPLRPAQESVLNEWFASHANKKDVIVKLHTGQGKTLVGLLMLQSKLNEKKGPSLYLCPNNYLVNQTCEQASQFGIATCTTDDDLPDDFLEGNKIFVTSSLLLRSSNSHVCRTLLMTSRQIFSRSSNSRLLLSMKNSFWSFCIPQQC
ncbi:DEAD/DEAH box helicase [uncultured Desulfovibrio sp.]|uniref:DEAD/DEAH box helicase family protein n=1 Tax=uncultured Desulfovibrio sp. TaxID=167968 RepID=UPI0026239B07|nr:DEAD/DEAH box helicase [uncultured Desulfovibrio sp.]